MEFMCVVPKDLRVKQEVILGRNLKELALIAGAMLLGFCGGLIGSFGNMLIAVIGLAIVGLIAIILTQPISGKRTVAGYCRIIRAYYSTQKIYKAAPLIIHKERIKLEQDK